MNAAYREPEKGVHTATIPLIRASGSSDIITYLPISPPLLCATIITSARLSSRM